MKIIGNYTNKIKSLFPLCAVTLCLASGARANQVIISSGGGPNDVVYSITSFTLTGETMASLGLTVKVTLANNTTSTVAWTSCGSGTNCGFASNGTWTLTETGDTGSVTDAVNPNATVVSPWTLINTSTDTNLAIKSVDLSGPLVTFDRHGQSSGSLQFGTPGSADGADFTFRSEAGANSPWTVSVSYQNMVTVNGPSAGSCLGTTFTGNSSTGCGDEWGRLIFTFSNSNPFAATAAGFATYSFTQDTDSVGTPEPATLGMLGAGLIGMGLIAKRRLSRGK